MNMIEQLEAEQIKALAKDIPDFAAGDTVRVGFQVTEGTRTGCRTTRASASAARAAMASAAAFTIRKISFGEGSERVSPALAHIDSITVVRRGRVRRAKLYYLRERRGKSARIAEKPTTRQRLRGQRPDRRPDFGKSLQLSKTAPRAVFLCRKNSYRAAHASCVIHTSVFRTVRVVFLRMLPILLAFGAIIVGIAITVTNRSCWPCCRWCWASSARRLSISAASVPVWRLGRDRGTRDRELLGSSMRLLFVQLLPSALVMLLLSALGITVIFGALYGAAPDLFAAFGGEAGPEELDAIGRMMPMLLFIIYLAAAVGFALFAVPMGATAANAIRRSPGYDMIWGLGKQFLPLFTVYFLTTAVPGIIYTAMTPLAWASLDPFESIGAASAGGGALLIGLLIYMLVVLYAPFVQFAAAALAFAVQREELEYLREAEAEAVFGMVEPEEDRKATLRDLRQQRAGHASATPVYQQSAPMPAAAAPRAAAPMPQAAPPVYTPQRAHRSRRSGAAARTMRIWTTSSAGRRGQYLPADRGG